MPQRIVCLNDSTVVAAEQFAAAVAALQIQVSRDFAPIWQIDAALHVITDPAEIKPDDWLLLCLDDSDQADALGYHDVGPHGQPLGKGFARTTIEDGGEWSVTLSHELLEMLVDPHLDQTAAPAGRTFAIEVCDACEEVIYDINGVKVSDFVTPGYFGGSDVAYDFEKQLPGPVPALLPGGYISEYVNGAWTQISDFRQMRSRMLPPRGSRRERRMRLWGIPQDEWKRSTL